MSDDILDVDLIAFETGDRAARAAVVDGVMRSLRTGFVFSGHDLSEDLLDSAYGMLAEFFSLDAERKARWVAPGSNGQAGYTGLLVETAAGSDAPDWKEMLNWGSDVPDGHPLKKKYPHRYMGKVLPEDDVPGITAVLDEFHDRTFELQRRFLRIIAAGLGVHEEFFEAMLVDGSTLTRAIRYPPMIEAPGAGTVGEPSGAGDVGVGSPGGPHVWAGEHGDINLITALPRATERGLQVLVGADRIRGEGGPAGEWIDAVPPDGHVIINTGIMLDRLTNGVIPVGVHRVVADPGQPGERYSVVQFCHPTPWTILSPIQSCITEDHPQRYAGIEAGDLLDEVIYAINLVEDGRRVDSDPSAAASAPSPPSPPTGASNGAAS